MVLRVCIHKNIIVEVKAKIFKSSLDISFNKMENPLNNCLRFFVLFCLFFFCLFFVFSSPGMK